MWAWVLGKDTKKSLKAYPLQESSLKIRKDDRENTSRKKWARLRETIALDSCTAIFKASSFV